MVTELIAQPKSPVRIRTPQRRERRRHTLKQSLWALLFLGPWILGFVVFTAAPMIASLHLSFTIYGLLSSPHWIGLANFERMFTSDPVFMKSLEVTLIYVGIGVPLELTFALLVAVALNRGMRGLGSYRSALYLPSLFGGSVEWPCCVAARVQR